MTTPAPIAAQPAHVLMALMEHFRGRHLLQIQGEPNQALAAIVGDLPRHPAEPVQMQGWRGWLDGQARRSGWFHRLYAKTQWGQDLVGREEEEHQRTLSAYERHERAEASRAGVWKNDTDRLALEAMDQSLLVAMHEQGWMSHVPIHQERPNGFEIPGPVSFNTPGAPGVTYMVSNAQGDFHWDGEPGKAEHRLKLNGEGAQRTLARWQVLLHEAAHCEFPRLQDPFRPTQGRWPGRAVDVFNTWVASNVTRRRTDFRAVLNECFADVYGAMMLLDYAGHSDDAQSVLAQVLGLRVEDRERADAEMETLADAWLPGTIADVHATDFALQRALEDRAAWEGQSPEVLRDLACQYASDGLLDFIDPQRLTPTGYPIGLMLCEELGSSLSTHASLTGYEAELADLWISKIRGGNPEKYLKDSLATHPAGPLLERAWHWMKPRLEEQFLQYGDAFEAQVARFDMEATKVVHHQVYACFKRFCSVSPQASRALRDAVVAEKRAFGDLQDDLRQWHRGPVVAPVSASRRSSPRP